MSPSIENCSCGTPGLNYEGPQEDCRIHGRPYDEVWAMLSAAQERLRAVEALADRWESEADANEDTYPKQAQTMRLDARELRDILTDHASASCGLVLPAREEPA